MVHGLEPCRPAAHHRGDHIRDAGSRRVWVIFGSNFFRNLKMYLLCIHTPRPQFLVEFFRTARSLP